MTVSEMLNNFLVEYDRVFSLSAPSYTNDEIVFFLNKGQTDLTAELIASGDNVAISNSDLVATHNYSAVLGTSAYLPSNAYILDLTSPTRFKHYLASYTELTRTFFPTISSGEIFKNDDIQKTDARLYESTTANSTIYRNPKAYLDGATVVVLYDNYTTTITSHLEYVKEPKILDISTDDATYTTTSELREDLHNAIVTKAVLFAETVTNEQKAVADTQLNKAI